MVVSTVISWRRKNGMVAVVVVLVDLEGGGEGFIVRICGVALHYS